MLLAFVVAGLLAVSRGARAQGPPCWLPGHSCPADYPCCSRDGQCGDSASYCILGCQPYLSHEVSSCAANPVCQDWSVDFRDGTPLNKIYQDTDNDFNGDPESFDWALTGLSRTEVDGEVGQAAAVEEDMDGIRLVHFPRYSHYMRGARLSSTRYVHYGKVDVIMKTAPNIGTTTTFMLMSDVRENARFTMARCTDDINIVTQGLLDRSETLPQLVTNETQRYESGAFYNSETIEIPESASDESHKYTIDWQEDRIIWSIDDEQVRRVNRSDIEAQDGINRYPSTPARIELALVPSYDIVLNESVPLDEHYWLTIQSPENLGAGVTGYVYSAEGSQESPRVNSTDGQVTASSAGRTAASAGAAVLFSAVLLGFTLSCLA